MRNKFTLVAGLLLAWGAQAAELKGVKMSDQIDLAGKSLVLNGLGTRLATIFKVNVYVAGLYLPTRSSDPDAVLASNDPKIVEMEFVRDVDAESITDTWKDSFDKNCGDKCAELRPKLDEFLKALVGAKKSDRVRYSLYPDHMEYAVNGMTKHKVDGADFGKVVLRVWLGPKPPNSELKEGMLGLGKKS